MDAVTIGGYGARALSSISGIDVFRAFGIDYASKYREIVSGDRRIMGDPTPISPNPNPNPNNIHSVVLFSHMMNLRRYSDILVDR
jgi:hypothetical protein